MITRQKILLSFLSHAGGKASRLNLVKWAFLFAREAKSKHLATFYQFVPYRFGPFSFTLYHELERMVSQGMVSAASDRYLETMTASEAFDMEPALIREVEYIFQKYGALPTSKLTQLVYNRYPWFTLNSEKKERRTVQRRENKPAVYTVGYEGYQIDGFLNLLLESGINQIIDVRCNPVSRRYGFHKSSLRRICNKLEIRYRHKPEVGIPSTWRTDLNKQEDYRRIFDQYEGEILPDQVKSISEISRWVSEIPTVLVCQEADPAYCHRSRLAKHISHVTGLDVLDLRM